MSLGDISVGFNSLLICFEMIIFAILHIYAFTWCEYDRGPHKTTPIFASLVDAFNPWDIVRATARGTRWLVCGVSRRRDDAEKVLERQKSEEVSGLVGNAAGFAGSESPPPGQDGGLSVYHPAPSDRVVQVNALKVQTGGYHPEAMEMKNSTLQPGRQRPRPPPASYSQQVANNGYGNVIAPPPSPHHYHERYRDQTPSPIESQDRLPYPTGGFMPAGPAPGTSPTEYLHSPISPVVAGAYIPMLPGQPRQK